MTDRESALDAISFAQPNVNDPALYDVATRSAYKKGFEDMRRKALVAVKPKKPNGELTVNDFQWKDYDAG